MTKHKNRNDPIVKNSPASVATSIDLNNTLPVDLLDVSNITWTSNLQGNILNGHGRDHTVNVFLTLPTGQAAKDVVAQIAPLVTSARQQAEEREQYRKYKIPGRLFVGLLLSANGYRKLGHTESELATAFEEEPNEIRNEQSTFLDGMSKHAEADFGDPPESQWDEGFRDRKVDLLLLLADDDEAFLKRAARGFINVLTQAGCSLATVEIGKALRTDAGEGIEHFGYVDGRSQPLFVKTDFQTSDGRPGFAVAADGKTMDRSATFEALEPDKPGGRIDIWDPFEPLGRVLVPDTLADNVNCFGSYFVFRKLEQNVRDFMIAEQRLADAMGLISTERERAGAMAVGRFRDGTPLVLSSTDGLLPPKDNNFRYDGLSGSTADKDGLRCPLQAHIRKTNPRGDVFQQFGPPDDEVAGERRRRIARRGIAYGERNRKPNTFQALDDLPSEGVGLLFMCFQASIRGQFAFLQRTWANNIGFAKATGGVGLDPLIGQLDEENGAKTTHIDQSWDPVWGKSGTPASFSFSGFVKMKGGEFFFAPSIPYLKHFGAAQAPEPRLAAFAGLPGAST